MAAAPRLDRPDRRGAVKPRTAPKGGKARAPGERTFLEDLRLAYAQMGIPQQVYLARYLAPLAAAGLAVSAAVHLFVVPALPGYLRLPMGLAVPVLVAAVIGLLPMVLRERRRNAIDHAMHFYITRAGVLAHANLGVVEIFRRLADRDAFGPLAEETERVVFLVTRWNMSMSGACRAVARNSPSAIFGEFLERLAYALDSGEELAHFLDSEQRVVMEDFATVYQGSLYTLETLKDGFLSIAMALVFMLVFGIVSPVLTGFRAEDFLLYALVFTGLIDSIFLMLMVNRSPSDPLWHPPTGDTPRERILAKAVVPSVAAGAALGLALHFATSLPDDLVIVASMTPLVGVGLLVRREEGLVRRRDDNYPAFVRALGSATSASGGVARQVLKRLRHHQFGPLTKPVDRLYRRLHLRIDDAKAWKAFAAESGSNLVAKFNAMFVEGARAGGEPEAIGRIISQNYVRILNLRKHRKQTAQSFRSMLLGFTAGMAFTMYIGVGVLRVLVDMFSGVGGADAAGQFIGFSGGAVVDFALVGLLVQLTLVLHCLLGAMMTQAVEGGSFLGGYADFVVLLWISLGAGMVSSQMFATFFPTG